MNKFDSNASNSEEDVGPGTYRNRSASVHHQTLTRDGKDRIAELEIENSRLHRLVAELLVKNQQLRESE
jgi:hypothetical protein